MLDCEMIKQLKGVFSPLRRTITLRMDHSDHVDQAELAELLRDLSSASPKIILKDSGASSPVPRVEIHADNKAIGISFKGIPSDHEFSSLVLAILHSDLKGKQLDAGIRNRIQKLKGPIRLKSYVSLACENCPDVVQVLNQIATLHPDFHHEMIDGAYVQDEIASLGIQGVPSVIMDGKLIHSGKAQFLDLLTKLESYFGAEAISL